MVKIAKNKIKKTIKTTYKESGVDVELGDTCSKIMYEASKQTWANRKGKIGEIAVPFDDFSGLRYVDISSLKDMGMSMNFDGVGTKIEIAERLKKHDTIAFDLFAMVCDDSAVRGAEPVIIGSIIDVNKLDADIVKELAKGMVAAAKAARVAVVNGEIAELGERVKGFGEFNYNWGATVVWMASRKNIITGKESRPGDKIVAFKEEGFRSNGISLVRNIMKKTYGENWHEKNKRLAEMVLTPSKIYCAAIVDMLGSCGIKAVAHITGGGIPGKLGRALKPSGYGADLHDIFCPPEIMLHCQKIGNVEDKEAYKTWNMGNGMMIITSEPRKVIEIAGRHGIKAKIIGEVVEKPNITIKSKGMFSNNKELVF